MLGDTVWESLRNRAKQDQKRIVFPEGTDERVLQAAAAVVERQGVRPWLLGPEETIQALAARQGLRLSGVHLVDPSRAPEREAYADALRTLPREQHLTHAEALHRISDPLLFGLWLLKTGQVDGFVGGATRTTADTIRATLRILGLAPGVSTLCGLFILTPAVHHPSPERPAVLLADCAVIPDPAPRQLAQIAVHAVEAFRMYGLGEPRVAFLSFSTRGSARHALVDRVRQATTLAQEKLPGVAVDGELQVDAALDRTVAARKGAGDSPVAGRANVLIMPSLEAGNIGYKLLQWLGGWRAVGPLLWGLTKPVSDLSRGCASEEIVDAAILTAILAQERKIAAPGVC